MFEKWDSDFAIVGETIAEDRFEILHGGVVEIDPINGLKALLSGPNYSAKTWVFEQYDTMVMADTIRWPSQGAGVIRVHGTDQALAFTSDVTPRYVRANPIEGAKQAVAEAYRNLIAT